MMVGLSRILIGMIPAFVGWIGRDLWRALAVALALLSFVLWQGRDNARDLAEQRKAQAAAWSAKFREQKAEMLKFVGVVRAARAEAARLDQQNIQRVEGHWRAIFMEASNDYQADLAAARAIVDQRMRVSAGPGATSAAGGGGGAAMSALPTLSTGPVRPGEAAIVDRADADACTINSLRLVHLISAWTKAAAIEVNGPLNGRLEAFQK